MGHMTIPTPHVGWYVSSFRKTWYSLGLYLCTKFTNSSFIHSGDNGAPKIENGLHNVTLSGTVFIARRYAKRGIYAVVVCLSLCVCVSVTRRYCTKTAKRRITQLSHDSSGTLDSDIKVYGEIRTGLPPTMAKNEGGWVKIGHFRQKRAITRKWYKIDACIVSIKVE